MVSATESRVASAWRGVSQAAGGFGAEQDRGSGCAFNDASEPIGVAFARWRKRRTTGLQPVFCRPERPGVTTNRAPAQIPCLIPIFRCSAVAVLARSKRPNASRKGADHTIFLLPNQELRARQGCGDSLYSKGFSIIGPEFLQLFVSANIGAG